MFRLRHIALLAAIVCLAGHVSNAFGQDKPFILGPIGAGSKTIQVQADPRGTIFICKVSPGSSATPPECSTSGMLAQSDQGDKPSDPPTTNGVHKITLFSPLTAGDTVYVTQVIGGTPTTSSTVTVDAVPNEREHTDFVGGTLLSANGSNYSQGNIFLALNYDRAIYRPGYYSSVVSRRWHPGLNTFFQARLTTIPVNASQTVTTATSTGSAPTSPTVSSFLAAQKAAQFGGGGYIPILFGKVPSRVSSNERNSAFYFGPVAKFGYSTPSGSPTGSSTANSGSTTTTTTTTVLGTSTVDNGQLYNFWLVGMRIATADLEPGSIHTRHYFDIGVGKYSNLQSLICNPKPATLIDNLNPKCQVVNKDASGTVTGYGPAVDPSLENRATLYRLAFEGYLEIPSANSSSFILGMSANTGPSIFSRRARLDISNRAVEDIDFLLAYKFDVTKLFAAVPLIGR